MTETNGSTLIELLVTLVVLGVVFAVVGLYVPARNEADSEDISTRVLRARQQAVMSGATTTTTAIILDTARSLYALPDGRLIADRVLGIEPLSGRRIQRAR